MVDERGRKALEKQYREIMGAGPAKKTKWIATWQRSVKRLGEKPRPIDRKKMHFTDWRWLRKETAENERAYRLKKRRA